MPKTIVIASGKGGVGKSTISAGVGRILSGGGIKTLLIDCDAGLSSLDLLLSVQEHNPFSWYDAYLERCTPEEATTKINDNLFLMTAPTEAILDDAETSVKAVTDKIKFLYDIIIIDAPAGLGRGLSRAANAANQAIIVATADEISVKGAAAVDKRIRSIGINQTRLIINRYSIKAAKKGKQLTVDELIDKTCVQLLGIVPEDKELSYFTVTETLSKKSPALRAFNRITNRIMGNNVELTLSLLK